MAFGSFLRKLKNVVAPVIGTAIAGPLGGVVAGGLANAFDEGDRFKNILKGAGTAAAGIGVSKGLSALKGAVTAGDTASKALSLAPGEGITEPASGMLAKKVGTDTASEVAKQEIAKRQITTPAVKALAPAVEGSTSVGANAARTASNTRTVARMADNPAGARFQRIANEMAQQRYDAAGGGEAGRAARQSFRTDELAPSMTRQVLQQEGLSERALEDLAREQIQTSAAENMARGGQPLGSFPSSTGGSFDAAVARNTMRTTPPSSGLTSRTLSRPVVSTPSTPTPIGSTPTPIGNGRIMDRLRELLSGVGGFAKENPEVAMGIAQGLSSAFSTSPQEREIEYMRELAAARARMLAPLYAQYSREFMG